MVARDGIGHDPVLTTRKLLILQADKKNKTVKKPIPLYVYCTVIFFEFIATPLLRDENGLIQ